VSTFNEIAYNIHNILLGGRTSNNEYYTIEQIKYNIKYYRALLIRRDLQRSPVRTTPFEQDIGVLELEKVDENGSYNDQPSYVLRTKKNIPEPLRLKGREGITFVGSPSGLKSYDTVNPNRRRYVRYSRFTNTSPRAFYQRGKVYVEGDPNIEKINRYIREDDKELDVNVEHVDKIRIRGIFVDPEEAIKFETGSPYNHDTEFPMPEDYIQRITQSMLNGEIRAMDSRRFDQEELPE